MSQLCIGQDKLQSIDEEKKFFVIRKISDCLTHSFFHLVYMRFNLINKQSLGDGISYSMQIENLSQYCAYVRKGDFSYVSTRFNVLFIRSCLVPYSTIQQIRRTVQMVTSYIYFMVQYRTVWRKESYLNQIEELEM